MDSFLKEKNKPGLRIGPESRDKGPSIGPNRTIPAEFFTTIDISSPVKIRYGENQLAKIPPRSVPGVLEEAAAKFPNKVALGYKRRPTDIKFETITFKDYLTMTKTVAKAFLKLGLNRLHCVSIIGFNSPEWFLSYLGAIFAGGVASGIYTTNSAEATFYCLQRGRSNIVVVDDETQVQKVLEYKSRLPDLQAVIQYSGVPTEPGVISWRELIAIGKREDEAALKAALKNIAINECCTLLYTSGTTGNPKGVMLSHDNLIWNTASALSVLQITEEERLVSYLPLSHVAALIVDMYCHILGKMSVYFAQSDALKGGLVRTLVEVKPTRFLGVPKVWEKMADNLKSAAGEIGLMKKYIIRWARSQGLQRNLDLMKGIDSLSLGYVLAKRLVFTKIKQKMGLDQCKCFWSGAAPLGLEVIHYLASYDIPIHEGFGMTEGSGIHTLNLWSAFKFGSTGKAIPGVKTKLHRPDSEKQGEICMYGRHICMGYKDEKEQTEAAIDHKGWLRSGDLGKLDKEGFLHITGRIKELLIMAGGESVSPNYIEQNVKAELPILGQAVVICDRKNFLSLLVTLSSEVHPDTGEPKDELMPSVRRWLRQRGFSFTTTSQVLESGPDPKILEGIQEAIDAANNKAHSNAHKIQKFAILPKDFSVVTGELGPTLKLKRNVINEKYKDVIETFYET